VAKPVKKQPSNSRFVGAILLVAVAGIAVLGYSVSRPRAGIKPVDPNLVAGTAEGYLVGNVDAPVQVLEFGDFECPACGQWANLTEPDVRERLIKTGLVSFRFYDFPLDGHKNTWPASNAVACAADQGKFLDMHDRVFASQDRWNGEATNNPKKVFQQLATESALDVAKWETCFDSQEHYPRIKANQLEGVRRGVGQTPSFIIGNTLYPGNIPFDEFRKYVEAAAAEAAKSAKPTKAPAAAAKAPAKGAKP
jgi:protein-disulfide isomerase